MIREFLKFNVFLIYLLLTFIYNIMYNIYIYIIYIYIYIYISWCENDIVYFGKNIFL